MDILAEREAEAALCRKAKTEEDFQRGFAYCEQLVRVALGGHECSVLWGSGGLLAATLRCVHALQRLEDEKSKE